MTENEAIKIIGNAEIVTNKDADYAMDVVEAVNMAIHVLETVQKYKDLESELSKRNLTIDHIREYMEFEDECVEMGFSFGSLLEARRKNTGRKPILKGSEKRIVAIDYEIGKGRIVKTDVKTWKCACCDAVVGERIFELTIPIDQNKKKFCENCGQRIDWEGIKNE